MVTVSRLLYDLGVIVLYILSMQTPLEYTADRYPRKYQTHVINCLFRSVANTLSYSFDIRSGIEGHCSLRIHFRNCKNWAIFLLLM